MTVDATAVALAAAIDALALVQGQLDRLERSHARVESTQREILDRLDAIDAGQAAVTDLLPVLEMILARSIEDREATRAGFSRVAQVAAFAHAAALGNGAPLPVDAADDPLLEPYLLTQPADRASNVRALVDWRRVAGDAGSAELAALLAYQYQASPTDTAGTRILRYQLAAITRAELEGRGVALPSPPASTKAADRSLEAVRSRSAELARLWQAGESAMLYAEPELAGALDLFAAAERNKDGFSEKTLLAHLAALHQDLGMRLEVGQRPTAVAGGALNITPAERPLKLQDGRGV
jgi:hypothetical protein